MAACPQRPEENGKAPVLMPKAIKTSRGPFEHFALFDLSDVENGRVDAGALRGVALSGGMAFDGPAMDRFPALEIIAKFGVGYDTVDVAAAAERGIVVTNTPDVLTDEVADLALGLLIATIRKIPQADRFLREGRWRNGSFPLSLSLRGRRVGIVGLGRIGTAIAKRVTALGLEVAYTSRRRKPDLEWAHHADPAALAAWADVLVVVVPGTPSTNGMIDANVLSALGPEGVLINVARGSVVDEPALVQALESGTIAAAGLDVFTNEPEVPARLVACENAVLLPHIGSGTLTTRLAMGDLVFLNLDSWFDGKGAVTPVTETSL